MEAAGRRLTAAEAPAEPPQAGPGGAITPESSLVDLDNFWQRTAIGFHVVYFGLLGLLALLIGSSGDLSSQDRLTGLIVVAVMAVVYALAGRPQVETETDRDWRTAVQVVVSWAGLYLLIGVEIHSAYFLLFGLIPHLWILLSTRWAVASTFVLSIGLALVVFAQDGWSTTTLRAVAPQIGMQIGLSLLMGLFITSVFIQAERRAALIDELRRTRTELAEIEHLRGVLAERERLSHEIHDTLAQGFTSILTLAQAIEVALDRDPPAARERLALVESTARDNLAEARALVNALAPVSLHDATLVEAIGRAVERVGRETEMTAEFQAEGEARSLPANDEVVLLRTTQEALANVRRHSAASRVQVALRFRNGGPGSPGSVTVAVIDDGCGFDPNDVAGLGYGLHGMRARVLQAGGVLDVVSAPGAGTTVRATLPLPPSAAADLNP